MICRSVMSLSVGVFSLWAHADFDLCNISQTQTMSVAWAFQTGRLIQSAYTVGGWDHIAPDSCEQLGTGNVANSSFWIHAVSNGIILLPGQRPAGSRIWNSDQQFCIADSDFEYDVLDAGTACASGYYLAPFPVTTWFGNDVADLRLEMNPDEFVASAVGQEALNRGPKLPDLHGTLVTSSSGMYYASMQHESREAARQGAFNHCQTSEPQAQCTLYSEFQNQCLVAVAGKTEHFVSRGKPDWTEQQTLDFALQQCRAKDGPDCTKILAACSTYVARSAEQKKRDAAAQQRVIDSLGEALRQIYQR